MNKRKPDNKTVDIMARKLFENSRVADGEIDRAVSNPQLFDLVCQRIADPPPANASLSQMRWRMAAVAGLAGVTLGAAALLSSEEAVVTVNKDLVPEAFPGNARPVHPPPQGTVEELSPGRAIKANLKVQKAAPRRVDKERQSRPRLVPGGEFYAVSYTGDDHRSTGGRIMRVELNRSALFAMGINLPLENDAETVKADLLIGSDGVTRGLRVVN